MKKQLLAGAFVLASFLTAQAQEIYSQSFEGTIAEISADGWGVVDFDGDGDTYSVYTSNTLLTGLGFTGKVPGSSNFIINEDDTFTPEDEADNVFWSPNVELPAGSSYASYRVGSSAITVEGGAAHYSVYVLTDADLEGIADLAALLAYVDGLTPNDSGDLEDVSEVRTIDLSDWAGEAVSLMFRHHDSDGNYAYFFMDDVTFMEGVAGVNENVLANLSVYPNPTSDVVNVSVDALVSNVAIADLNGRTVKTVKFDGVSNASVNVSDLASGVYMMTVSSDKGTTTKKIVKN
jgi:hypothetical protein